MAERVCITGCGVVSPLGDDLERFWRAMLGEAPPPRPVSRFDATRYRVDLAHQIEDRDGGGANRARSFALAAARSAVGRSAPRVAPHRIGLSLATTSGGWELGQSLARALSLGEEVSLRSYLGSDGELTRDAPVKAVAGELGLSGPVAVPSAACAASAYAIAWGVERIRAGDADLVLAGGVDTVTELAYAGFHSVRALAPDACRPFSRDRRGIVLGEGAALLVLEAEASARRRGAPVLAEVLGYSLSTDTRDMTNPSAAAVERAMGDALEEAGCEPRVLGSISAHGTGTPSNDRAEGEAIAALLGEDVEDIPVCAIKSAIGHTQGAAAAFGCVGAVLATATGRHPPLRNYLGPDPELPRLRLAGQEGGGAARPGPVLVNAFGFGGATASVVVGPGRRGSGPRGGRRRPRRSASATRRPVCIGAATVLLADAAPLAGAPADRRLTIEWGAEAAAGSPSALVLRAMRLLTGAHAGSGPAERCGAYLGTFYGSQAIHEGASLALERSGPTGYRPRDFAVSTYNAPVGAAAIELGLRGPTTAWLGMNAGLGAIGAAADLVARGGCERMVAGGYDLPTPMLAALMQRVLSLQVEGAAALMLLSGEREGSLAEILAWGSLGPAGIWPAPAEVGALLDRCRERAGAAIEVAILCSGLDAGVAGPAVLAGLPSLRAAALVDVASRFGPNRLAAAGPLGVVLALEAAAGGGLVAESAGEDGRSLAIGPGTVVAVLAAGPMTGLDAVLVRLR